MKETDNPLVNRAYLLNLVGLKAPELCKFMDNILPNQEVIDCNVINNIIRNQCYQLQEKGIETLALRTMLCDTNDGREWFNVFVQNVLPFFTENKGV